MPEACGGAQVPAYFALILRAFSVIEGIALRVDPTYSIVQVAALALAKPCFWGCVSVNVQPFADERSAFRERCR